MKREKTNYTKQVLVILNHLWAATHLSTDCWLELDATDICETFIVILIGCQFISNLGSTFVKLVFVFLFYDFYLSFLILFLNFDLSTKYKTTTSSIIMTAISAIIIRAIIRVFAEESETPSNHNICETHWDLLRGSVDHMFYILYESKSNWSKVLN